MQQIKPSTEPQTLNGFRSLRPTVPIPRAARPGAARSATFAAVSLAMAGTLLPLSSARAQTTTTTTSNVFLIATAAQGQDTPQQQTLYNTTGPAFAFDSSDQAFGGNAAASANLGVLHARADATGSVNSNQMDSDNSVQNAEAEAVFGDIVYVSDPGKLASALVPATVTFGLEGNLALGPPPTFDSVLGVDDDANVGVDASWYSIIGPPTSSTSTITLLAEGSYDEDNAYDITGTGQPNGGVNESGDTITGSKTFTTYLQNDSYYLYTGTLGVTAGVDFGGYAGSFFSDTALFNVTSLDPNATFTGALGTNYSTLTDGGTGAAAPEPTALALLAFGSCGALVGRFRLRHRGR